MKTGGCVLVTGVLYQLTKFSQLRDAKVISSSRVAKTYGPNLWKKLFLRINQLQKYVLQVYQTPNGEWLFTPG